MKYPVILLAAISLLMPPSLLAQVAISADGSAPHSSAMLEVKSTDRGILVPRLTTAQRTGITGPAEGLLVYDSDTDSFWFYSGSAWQELRTGAGTELTDADNDTKVTVDNGSDEDLIRFQLGGTEKMVLRNNSLDLNPGNDNVIVAPFSGSLITSASNNSIFGYSAGQMNATGNYSSFFGSSAGFNNIDGNSNVAMGAYSLFNNTSGSHNVAIGNAALYNGADRSDLVAVGDSALYKNGLGASGYWEGTRNTAIGSKTLANNTTGYLNTAIGYNAMYTNLSGSSNTALGYMTLFNNIDGWCNTAIGINALGKNIIGSYNTALGLEVLYFNEYGWENSGLGFRALFSNEGGSYNTSIGNESLYYNISGENNTAVGYQAGYGDSDNSFSNSTLVGYKAGYALSTGSDNILIGYHAGDNLTTGSKNIIIGYNIDAKAINGMEEMILGHPNLLYGDITNKRIGIGTTSPAQQLELTESLKLSPTTSSTTGVIYKGDNSFIHNYQPVDANGENTFVGINSGNFTLENPTWPYYMFSSYNTAVGYNSLHSTTNGFSNTAIGNNALFSNNGGNNNTAVGDKALYSNSSGSDNAAIGSMTLYSNTSGYGNTAVGSNSLYNNHSGDKNTVIGYEAGLGNENNSFSNNTLLGYKAGYALSTGSDNILIGYQAGDNLTTGSKNIIIGYNIEAKASNGMEEMILGHPNLLYGDITFKRIGIGTPSPQEQLHLKNTGSVTILLQADSDNDNGDENENPRFELKQDGEVVTGGLGFIGENGALYDNSLANSLYLVNEYSTPLQLGTADSVVMTILGNAKVGIGTTDPIQRLDVNGNARFRNVGSSAYTSALNLTANGTLTTNTSDIRLKTNIETLNDGLERVMKLRGVEFNWKSEPESKKMIGFIAQETEQAVPELVFTNPTDGYMGINYAEMTAVLVEAVKQQQKMIEELQQKVAKLEGK